MEWYQILYIALFSALTLTLIVLKLFKIGSRRRGVVKMLAAAMFVALGIYGCALNKGGLSTLACIALFFAALGDLFLVFKDSKRLFVFGVLSFGAASLLLSVYSILKFGWIWWSVILFAAAVAFSVLCQVFRVYRYGSLKIYLNVYTLLVGLCGTLGFSLACQGTANLATFLFGLGCFAYFVSDVCLGLNMFRVKNRVLDAVNTLLYFPGMFLIAASMLF
ncbi:MAG: lysoplasmalogenase [Corallococcus sp.]|nr:lysoplasmalogenase [Corallococcus sp.]MCM1359360.1 lysoplasmalogenase [Corallococcus sp.]MCM1394803.1 lysoplasmalogenase [Corallococcus sp.]